MVDDARRTGTVRLLNEIARGPDPAFPLGVGMSSDGGVGSGVGISVRAGWYGTDAPVTGAFRVMPLIEELVDDTLAHRQESCARSGDDDGFAATLRAYRAYVQTSVSLLELFLHQPVQHALSEGRTSTRLQALSGVIGFEPRIETWVAEFAPAASMRDIKMGKEWSDFQALRQERNDIAHALKPYAVYEIRTLPRRLNLVRDGVGGMMRLLRQAQGKSNLWFIDTIQTAPEVSLAAHLAK